MSFGAVYGVVICSAYLVVCLIQEAKAKPEESTLTWVVRRTSIAIYSAIIAIGVSNVKV